MERKVELDGIIIDDIGKENTEFATGVLLSSALLLDKDTQITDINVKALQKVQIEEILTTAKYICTEGIGSITGSIEQTDDGFLQFLWVNFKENEASIKGISTIVVSDYFISINEEEITRNSSINVTRNNGDVEIISIDPIILSKQKFIDLGKEYNGGKRNGI